MLHPYYDDITLGSKPQTGSRDSKILSLKLDIGNFQNTCKRKIK